MQQCPAVSLSSSVTSFFRPLWLASGLELVVRYLEAAISQLASCLHSKSP